MAARARPAPLIRDAAPVVVGRGFRSVAEGMPPGSPNVVPNVGGTLMVPRAEVGGGA
jgi:hypothetical protein